MTDLSVAVEGVETLAVTTGFTEDKTSNGSPSSSMSVSPALGVVAKVISGSVVFPHRFQAC